MHGPLQTGVDGLNEKLDELKEACGLKKQRLTEAYQALLFSRTLDGLETWMDDVETQLQSEDHGHDLTSVKNLLVKHLRLETDIGELSLVQIPRFGNGGGAYFCNVTHYFFVKSCVSQEKYSSNLPNPTIKSETDTINSSAL